MHGFMHVQIGKETQLEMLDSKLRPSLSFYRQYYGYTGGHQKVHDYIKHFIALGWVCDSYRPFDCDVTFLAGMDWQAYLAQDNHKKPHKIINLIQHVRHADPKEPLYEFLRHRAIRLCVSDAVRDAVSPFANGPCYTIKMGHDIPCEPVLEKTYDVYILGLKQPELAVKLVEHFSKLGLKVFAHTSFVSKNEVLSAMAASRGSVCLPHKTEGFFLPALEAAHLSDIAIIPNCVASQEYSSGFTNIMTCAHEFHAICAAVQQGLRLLKSPLSLVLSPIRKYKTKTLLSTYSLENEKKRLSKVLFLEDLA